MKQQTILLIGGNAESRREIKGLLAESYKLLEAQSESEALEALCAHADTALMLLDVTAPGGEGFSALQSLASNKSFEHIPIVAITEKDDASVESTALSLGAMDYIAKPYSPYTVKRRLANIISSIESHVEMELASQLVDDSSSAVYVCDAETYELLYVNQTCARMCKKTVADAQGKTCYAYLKGANKPCAPCYMETSREDRYTLREYSSPASGRHYAARDKFINWGGRRALVEYLNDESERINSRLALEASQRGMEAASVNGGVSFWNYDIDKKLLSWGSYHRADYMGYPDVMPNVPEAMMTSGEVHPDDVPAFSKMYDDMFANAESAECTVRLLNHKTQKFSWHHLVYTRLHDPFYTSRQAVGFAVNVDLQQELSAHYEHELKLRHELIKDCESYYQINLTNNSIEEYHSKHRDIDIAHGAVSTPSGETLHRELLKHVAPEDRAAVADTFFIEGLLKRHQRGESATTLDFRRTLPNGITIWLRGTVTIMKKPTTNELIAFVYNRNVDREKKDQLALDHIIGEEIESTCLVNVKSGMAHLLKITDGQIAGVHQDEDFSYDETSALNIQSGVVPEDRPLLEPISLIKNIVRALEAQPSLIVAYRTNGENGTVRRKRSMLFYLDESREDIVISRRDVTRLYEAEMKTENMRKNEELLRLVVEHSARVIYRYNVATHEAVSVQPEASEAMGLPAFVRDMPKSLIDDGIIVPEDAKYVLSLFANARTASKADSMRFRVRGADGATRWLDVKYTFVNDGSNPTAAVISCLDVTKQHERELAYARYRQSAENVQEGSMLYFETDITADVIEKQGGEYISELNGTAGYTHSALIEHVLRHNFTDANRDAARRLLSRDHLLTMYADGEREISRDWQVRFSDGKLHWAQLSLQMVADPFTGHIKIFTTVNDVTKERQSALDFQKRAELDGMTGLYNKTTAEALIRARLATASSTCALIVIDLDYLKAINDGLGHKYGDKAIISMADALSSQFRKTDIVGRIGGDEFIAFLENCGNEAKLRSLLTAFMRKLASVCLNEENSIPLRASIGVAVSPAGEEDYAELFKRADRALYQVKRNGKDDFAFYTPEMEQEAFQYTSHREVSIWQTRYFDNDEMDRLLKAVSSVFTMVISVNLTQNSYYMMQYENYPTRSAMNAGVFDDLISQGASSFHPDDREAFLAAFKRENLLVAFGRGEQTVSYTGRQLGDDGAYRLVRTDVIFSRAKTSGDVLEITLAREVSSGV